MTTPLPEHRLTVDALHSGTRRTAVGVPEVTAAWVRENLGRIRIVDVRSVEECRGPMGTIPTSEIVPLEQLEVLSRDWDREEPLVISCRSGARSGHAAVYLERMGFKAVASMAGGILDWRGQGY